MAIKIVFVLDRSGSMQGLETDVIGGFNSFISEQKKLKDKATLTTVLFDNYYEVLHDNVDLQKIEPLTNKQYFVRGTTALLDAVGKTINHVDHRIRKNDKVLFIINTDGLENASQEFSKEVIKELIEHLEKEHDWKFIFLGANIDAFAAGGGMGIFYTFNVDNSPKGIMANYDAVSYTTSTFRNTRGATMDTSKLENLDKSTP